MGRASGITHQTVHIFSPESITAVCFPGAPTKQMYIGIAFLIVINKKISAMNSEIAIYPYPEDISKSTQVLTKKKDVSFFSFFLFAFL